MVGALYIKFFSKRDKKDKIKTQNVSMPLLDTKL